MVSEKLERRLFFGSILAYFLISGIDYALVLPTINSYLLEVGASSIEDAILLKNSTKKSKK